MEELVARTWCEVLGLANVGRDANFFELGGHSLLATQVISRLGKACNQDFPVRLIFEASSVAALAAMLESQDWSRKTAPALESFGPTRAADLLERLEELSEDELEELLSDSELKSAV
jgi:hypothetical protein